MGTGAVNDFDATHAKMVEAVEAAGLEKDTGSHAGGLECLA